MIDNIIKVHNYNGEHSTEGARDEYGSIHLYHHCVLLYHYHHLIMNLLTFYNFQALHSTLPA